MRQLPQYTNRHVLVGSATADDAGVFRLDRDRALVQTTDFFTPIVDDPFAYGQIAAANALSDVFAMGGRPITALNIMGMPTDLVSEKTIATILRGGLEKAREVGCAIIGGHTIRNPEPIYGLAVTGMVSPKKILTNAKAKPGDLLVLTKPLGTGIATTGIKRGLTSREVSTAAIKLMSRVNTVGAELAERGLVRAATDVTGFGLVGHLTSMCRASGVSADVDGSAVPAICDEIYHLIAQGCVPGGTAQNLETANTVTSWGKTTQDRKLLLTDAQTSGGLLLAVSARKLKTVLHLLTRHEIPCRAIIGKITRRRRELIR
ncbi:MAG TPA: selenide, water dikinase SelD, partial [Chthoniobacterales bacterium]|nr:selenide, water dikinase SelD [Chthoniobacterales bacterium]